MSPPGLLILDNSCYKHLENHAALARFRGNLRAADFVAQPSELNLVEAGVSPAAIRSRVVRVIRDVIGRQPLVPWPIGILKEIGIAIVNGRPTVVVGPSGKEWYLDDENAMAERSAEVAEFAAKLEKSFDSLHARFRMKLQRLIKQKRLDAAPESTASFLDGDWFRGEARQEYANVTWRSLGLPGDPPMVELNKNEPWRLLLDAEGLALYERAIAKVQPKVVHRFDLLQMIYLGIAPRRMIATADKPLLRAANAILNGRYQNARAVHITELIG